MGCAVQIDRCLRIDAVGRRRSKTHAHTNPLPLFQNKTKQNKTKQHNTTQITQITQITQQRVLQTRLDECLLTDAEWALYRDKAQAVMTAEGGGAAARALYDAFPNRMEIDMSPQGPVP